MVILLFAFIAICKTSIDGIIQGCLFTASLLMVCFFYAYKNSLHSLAVKAFGNTSRESRSIKLQDNWILITSVRNNLKNYVSVRGFRYKSLQTYIK